ncbi:SURF1-like protein [Gemmobacter nanjingensis]|uniref:SURF1-like protein n=1 Tax=Gemmobacter nanjingensis TaxID=488454 RepID=A0ABQ3F6J0_9RHOB|nr:SURF1 family protein [Gemmobacter nanjingensis]GHC09168.1 SURF1-like protein [Gemmobacter nanjingensis]
MTRRMILPLLFGLVGCAILIGLGSWQMQRLHWKEGVLAEIEARIAAAPVLLPDHPESPRDRYLPVVAEGRMTGEGLKVLASRKLVGPGHRLIGVLETGGRRVLVDLGFVPDGEPLDLPQGPVRVVGNLHWPEEKDSFTPEPNPVTGLWFARDVPAMAVRLGTEPTLIVAREPVVPEIAPLPVDTSGIPNDHLGYALTWFLLAVAWAGMTVLFLWRIRRRNA